MDLPVGGVRGGHAEAGEVDAATEVELDAFVFQEDALEVAALGWGEGDAAGAVDDAVPGEFSGAALGVEDAGDLAGGAGVAGECGDLSVGGDGAVGNCGDGVGDGFGLGGGQWALLERCIRVKV